MRHCTITTATSGLMVVMVFWPACVRWESTRQLDMSAGGYIEMRCPHASSM